MVELVQNPILEEFLVGDSHSDWIGLHASFFVPLGNERDVVGSSGSAGSLVEGFWCP